MIKIISHSESPSEAIKEDEMIDMIKGDQPEAAPHPSGSSGTHRPKQFPIQIPLPFLFSSQCQIIPDTNNRIYSYNTVLSE